MRVAKRPGGKLVASARCKSGNSGIQWIVAKLAPLQMCGVCVYLKRRRTPWGRNSKLGNLRWSPAAGSFMPTV